MHMRQTGGPPRSTDPTGQPEPRRLAVDRAISPPMSQTARRSVRACSGHQAAPTGARTWPGGLPEQARRRAWHTAVLPHRGHTSPVHGMTVRGALELQHHQTKLTPAKEGKEGGGNSPPARSRAPTSGGE
jgi:hypothetical protein